MREATTAQESGDLARAERAYSELIERFPTFPDAWHYYGILLHQGRQPERALELMRHAERLAPRNLVFLLNLATVLRDQRRLNESLETLQKAYTIDPEHGQIFAQLVQIHLLAQRGGDLIEEVERRLRQHPDDRHLWMLLGECLEQGGERERALEAFARAAQYAPAADVEAAVRSGWAARAAGHIDAAETAFRGAVRHNHGSAQAFVGLATTASERARFRRAAVFARRALTLDPDCHAAWRILANTDAGRDSENFLSELERAAARSGEAPRAWLLHFARGQAWERRGDYERAFAAYALGNAQRSAYRPYSRADQANYTTDIIRSLDRSFVDRAQTVGVRAPEPIFICGMPRSGTTLVETILAAHPEVTPGGEMRHIHDQLRRRLRHHALAQTGTWLRNADNATLGSLAKGWSDAMSQAARGRRHATDKMPGNFTLLGLIDTCLPDSRIVHVRREARDNCFSCFATPFSEGMEFSFSLADVGHFYQLYAALMEHWRSVLGPERIIEIEYEALVAEPEVEIRRLLEKLDLQWEPRCLEFHKTKRTVNTASVYQVRKPIYSSSIGRWRHFEQHLTPLFEALQPESAPDRGIDRRRAAKLARS